MSDRAIFLDRDETLIKDPGYISSPDQVELLDGVPEALIKLKDLGYKLIVVSNQSAVARGIITERVLGKIHDRLKQLLAEKDAFIDRIYYCPYHPDGIVQKYRKESDNRKPNPGMLLTAAKDMDIDMDRSWCVGNSIRDIEAGHRAGCKTILIDVPSRQKQSDTNLSQSAITPDYKGVNLREAVNIIKKHLRSSSQKKAQNESSPTIQNNKSKKNSEQNHDLVELYTKTAEIENQKVKSDPEKESEFIEVTEPTLKSVDKTPPVSENKSKHEQKKIQSDSPEPDIANNRTEQLLVDILGQLRSMQRTEMFSEFSIMRLMAGIVQIIVLFCLLITIWFLMSPESRDTSIFIALGFAMVFQLMSLTFYIMHGRK